MPDSKDVSCFFREFLPYSPSSTVTVITVRYKIEALCGMCSKTVHEPVLRSDHRCRFCERQYSVRGEPGSLFGRPHASQPSSDRGIPSESLIRYLCFVKSQLESYSFQLLDRHPIPPRRTFDMLHRGHIQRRVTCRLFHRQTQRLSLAAYRVPGGVCLFQKQRRTILYRLFQDLKPVIVECLFGADQVPLRRPVVHPAEAQLSATPYKLHA